MKEYKLGKRFGLNLSAAPSVLLGSILLLVILGGAAIFILGLPTGQAILGSLLALVLHWVSTLVHHLGHAYAARQTGYPMAGIRFGLLGLLGTSLYPPEEPPLAARIHIRRALGGPTGSLLLSILALLFTLVFRNVNDVLGWVGVFFFLENLFVFTLGVFLPLGFTDGSTLLHWWRKG